MNMNNAPDSSAEIDHQETENAAAMRASGRLPASGAIPRIGELLRDFTLPSSEAAPVRLAAIRRQRSLVLIFAGAAEPDAVLANLLRSTAAFESEDAVTLAVLALPPDRARRIKEQQHWACTVLADADAAVHRKLGAGSSDRAVYVTDRFGEVTAAWRTAAGDNLPPPEQIIRCLRHIGLVCPECGFPEWPVD